MIAEDIEFIKDILPNHYKITESKKAGNIHCVSNFGISDEGKEVHWNAIFNAIKSHFKDRFQEVFHNVCYRHTDFTIYLKQD